MTWHTEFVANSYQAANDEIEKLACPQSVKEMVSDAIAIMVVPDGKLLRVKCHGSMQQWGVNVGVEVSIVEAVLVKASDKIASQPATEDADNAPAESVR